MKRLSGRDSLYLVCFLLAALVLLTLPHQRKLVLATALRSTVLAPVLKLQSGLAELRAINIDIHELRTERDSLATRLVELQEVEEENLRLRALLGLAERTGVAFRPANLQPTGSAAEIVKRSFVLDVGSALGVRGDAAVVAAGGLVGVVRVVTEGQATGDFWTHPEFRVSAMTTDGRIFGIIRSLSERPLVMQLDGTPYQAELPPETRLVTSGQGGVFPRGIPVGQVIELRDSQAGWAKSYTVKPAVYPDEVREVMVLVVPDETSDVGGLWEPVASRNRR